MLPATWHILSAGIARRLSRASLLARDQGDYEVTAMLYVKGRRIEGLRLLKNLSKKPGKFECKGEEYDRALAKAPSWATSSIFFHSHPISDEPSCADVTSARSGNQMIFGCSSRNFYLYQYPRQLRKIAKKKDEWRPTFNEVRGYELPLYVETGVRSFDVTILKGEVHPRFLGILRKYLYEFLKETVQAMDGRGVEVIQTPSMLDRVYVLVRLFGGLEYYVQFPKHQDPKKKLKKLGAYQEDFIISAYEIFYVLSSYLISQEKE